MNAWIRLMLCIAGLCLYTFSGTYTANPNAPVIAYIAAVSGAVGGYLLGLFQDKPGAPQ